MYTLDGLPLDDPQGRWYLHERTGLRIMPARMSTGASLPGRDGVLPSLGSAYEAGFLNLTLSVNRGTHGDMMGGVELLYGLLSQRHKLLRLVHDYGNGQTREAMVEIVSTVEPEMLTLEFSRLDVQCRVPSGCWRDPSSTDSTIDIPAGTTPTSPVLPGLAGGTGPVNDALIRFRGNFASAVIEDVVSGDQLTINESLTSTQFLVVDTARWVARKHSSDSWSTTSGTNVIQQVVSNRGSGPMFTLNPDFTFGTGRYRLRVTGVNPQVIPQVTVRAKRSFI